MYNVFNEILEDVFMGTLNEKTLVWAHRGACGYRPENTLEAFALAVEMGADGVELDVHLTRDGYVVVNHDEKIDRTSNGQGLITDYTLDELKAFDFGYKFYGERRGVKIPTLDEVYELLAPTGLTVNVELKSADPAICPACDAVAKKHGMENKVIYSSFNHLQLAEMKKVNADAKIAPLYGFNLLNPWNYANDIGAAAVHPEQKLIDNQEEYVEKCHALGIRVNTWTVNTEEQMKHLLTLGCDALISNYPDIAIKVREEFLA